MCCVCHAFPASIGESFCSFCLEDLRQVIVWCRPPESHRDPRLFRPVCNVPTPERHEDWFPRQGSNLESPHPECGVLPVRRRGSESRQPS